jgi:hypothetical protein
MGGRRWAGAQMVSAIGIVSVPLTLEWNGNVLPSSAFRVNFAVNVLDLVR